MLDPDVVAKLRLQLVVSPQSRVTVGINRYRPVTKSMTKLIIVCTMY
jgi:hypothetical protein